MAAASAGAALAASQEAAAGPAAGAGATGVLAVQPSIQLRRDPLHGEHVTAVLLDLTALNRDESVLTLKTAWPPDQQLIACKIAKGTGSISEHCVSG